MRTQATEKDVVRETELPFRHRAAFSALFVLDHVFHRKNVERLAGGARRRLKQGILEHLRPGGEGRVLQVERVADMTPEEFFRRCGDPGRPIVFTAVAKEWKACKEWSFDAFRERFGDDEALLVNHEIYGESVGDTPYEYVRLRDLIDHQRAGGSKYARFHPLLERHPELLKDIDEAWLTARMYNKTGSGWRFHTLFMGGAGTKTAVHSAGNDNLFLQIEGQKRWHLWPSSHTYVLDPEANRGPAKYCDLEPSDPDYEKYEAYRYVDTWTTDLNPGELLYVPAYAWHHVENLTPTIGIGIRWTSLSNSFHRSPLMTIMEFFNTNPSIVTAVVQTGEIDFNRIIMMSMGLGDQLRREEAARAIAKQGGEPPRKRRWLLRAFAVAASLLVVLALGEGILRLLSS